MCTKGMIEARSTSRVTGLRSSSATSHGWNCRQHQRQRRGQNVARRLRGNTLDGGIAKDGRLGNSRAGITKEEVERAAGRYKEIAGEEELLFDAKGAVRGGKVRVLLFGWNAGDGTDVRETHAEGGGGCTSGNVTLAIGKGDGAEGGEIAGRAGYIKGKEASERASEYGIAATAEADDECAGAGRGGVGPGGSGKREGRRK